MDKRKITQDFINNIEYIEHLPDHLKNDKELVIYIDNSFSTQLIDTKGVSLQTHLQKLYSQDFYDYKINWLTNDFSKRNTSAQNFKNDILKNVYIFDYFYNQILFVSFVYIKEKEKINRKVTLILIEDE